MPTRYPKPANAASPGIGQHPGGTPKRPQVRRKGTASKEGSDNRRSARGDLFLGNDVSDQILKLLVSQSNQRRWLIPLLEDAVQEVESMLLEWGLGRIRHKFSKRYFDDPEYLEIKHAIFKAIEKVLDKLRDRHKVEVKPGSVWFDDSKVKLGHRQRRDVPKNQFLGQDDRSVPDSHERGTKGLDMSLDIGTALDALTPLGREVVLRKVQLDESWESIADDLGIPVSRAKLLYKNSMIRLTDQLKAYSEFSAPVARNTRVSAH